MTDVVTYSHKQSVFSDPGVSGTCIVSKVHRPTLVNAIYDQCADAGHHQHAYVLLHNNANWTAHYAV
jgi:hypothetical protein